MHSFRISSIFISLLSLYTTTTALPIPAVAVTEADLVGSWGVIGQNFPDPSFIKASDGLYAFATSGNGKNIQIAKSTDFDNPSWTTLETEPLPNPGPWTNSNQNIWAPYVTQTTSGTFVMYYAAPPATDPSKHCIGTATSTTITGPYTPANTPFACNIVVGGAIDPSFFTDPVSSNTYVMYKIDGNSLGSGAPTPIMLQQVNPSDGTTQIGSPTTIYSQNASDGPLVEAPTMMYANGTYFLLFSTHMYDTAAYDIRYTSATALTGPYNPSQTVLLETNDGNGIVAPGSCDVHDAKIVFHGTVKPDPNLTRDMYAGYLEVQGQTLKYVGSV